MIKTLVIIPTYNEKENIKNILTAIDKLSRNDTEILVVDDSSPDGTAEIVKNVIPKLKTPIHLLVRKNKNGLGKAYVEGFKWALKGDYDFVISMDADFSHDPQDLPKLIDASKEYDIVIGSRYIKGGKIIGWDIKRQLNSRLANLFTRIALGLKAKDVTAGFKRYKTSFLEELNLDSLISSGYAFQVEMVFRSKAAPKQILEVPITFVDRRVGQSKIAGELKKSAVIVWRLFIRRTGVRQFMKFAIVGFGNFLFDTAIYFVETRFLNVGVIIAKTISFVASATSSYYFNRKWTFRSNQKNITRQYLKFIFISGIGLAINVSSFYLFHKTLGIYDLISLVFATAITTFWNFTANKKWTFK